MKPLTDFTPSRRLINAAVSLSTIMIALVACAAAAIAAQSGDAPVRKHILLDSNWRFYREATSYDPLVDWGAKLTNWQCRPYPGDTLPTDPATLAAESKDTTATDWEPVAVGDDVFHGRVGYAWFRATLPANAKISNSIYFGGVDDNATVFLNGVMIGQHKGWNTPFAVPVGTSWMANSANEIDVLVQNTYGSGGITEPVLLRSAHVQPIAQTQAAFNDRSWRIVHLPHDYVVEGAFDPNAEAGHGFLPMPSAWYRRLFDSPKSYKGKSIEIDFEGVYRNAEVWLNGHYLGDHQSGYAGFRFNVAPYLNYGGSNILAVHVDLSHDEGWFYEGGGIYRHVWLTVTDPVHIAPDGTFVSAIVHLANRKPWASILIRTEVANTTGAAQHCTVESTVYGPDGKHVITSAKAVTVPAYSTVTVTQGVGETNARLWSLEHPQLYTLRSSVIRNDRVVDNYETDFGLRSIYFDPNKGFFLNGKHIELKGTCNHQDFAGVGIAIPDNLFYWRVKKLKEMGCNAYRTSHNEVAPSLLDACDRLGMLVMDENRHFGDTQEAKSPMGTQASDLSDLKQMVRRDRNHPSVILWSIANEEYIQSTPDGRRIGLAMRNAVNLLDGTRPITAAMNGGQGPGTLSDALDIQGFNYHIEDYAGYHAAHPTVPLFGSETASDVGTRGEYAVDDKKGYLSAYDVEDPRIWWGYSAEDAWAALAKQPFMAGGFVWTGFDYRGEPTPYNWPDINSNFGIMDMCGFPKADYYYYQAWWIDKPMVHIIPHWTWAGKEGQPIDVWVFGNTDRVELIVNGNSLGFADMPKYGHVAWSVPYEPGTLVAKGYTNGKLIATDTVETTGEPARVRLTVDDPGTLHANGEDAVVIDADIVDSRGRIVPTADNMVHFVVTGAAHIDGVGNGDPSCHEHDKGSSRSAFNGRCIVVVQTNDGKTGPIRVKATSPGLKPSAVTVAAQ